MSSSEMQPPADDSAPRRRAPGRLLRLCRKELREILRDRRTIVTLVLMPLLVYPLLSITFQKFFLHALSPGAKIEYIIGVDLEREEFAELHRQLEVGDQWLRLHAPPLQNERAPPLIPGAARPEEPEIKVSEGGDLISRVADGSIDVAIIHLAPPEDAPRDSPGGPRWRLVYSETSALSRAARDYIELRLRAANERHLHERFVQLGGARTPAAFESIAVSEPPSYAWLTTMIPLILILMTITGAVYPAIDLTAGERERGTLETLMAAPVPRGELLLAKYAAVLTVALLTASANLAAMTITLSAGGFSALLLGDGGLTPLMLLQVFCLTALFAAFFSAVVLALTSFARSFKEAQAYLIPLMLLCLTPGVLSLMPGLKLTPALACVPLVNIVLLARDVLAASVEVIPAIVSIVSTLLYALAAIGVAARVFGSDAILYGSQAGWSELFRRPAQRRVAGTLPGALLCLALLFPCTYLASGLLGRLNSVDLIAALSGVATLLIYGGLPGLFAYLQHVDPTPAFRALPPRPVALLAAALLGVSVWPLAHESFFLGEYLGLGGLSLEKMNFAQQVLEQWRAANPVVILLAYALLPALCEEWFFRGYLFSALLKSSGPAAAVLLSALLFGLFHVVAANVLATERFLPTLLLGLLLGIVCWRSGSVLPGIIVHLLHNGTMISLALFGQGLTARGFDVGGQSHLPLAWVAASVAAVVVGLGMLFLSRPPRTADSAEAAPARQALSEHGEELETTTG
jgi:ABC-2 type transport system permease protein/sodium transport system permease protein